MTNQTTALLGAFESLPDEDKREFTAELLRRANSFSSSTPSREKSDQWLENNRDRFPGKWVALHDGVLLAAGDNGKAVYDQARAAGVQTPLRNMRTA